MNKHGDDLYTQFEAAQRHQHWLQQQNRVGYSWSTILITGFTIFATLAYTGIIHASPDRILSLIISSIMRATSRLSSWLPGGVGMGARDGGALGTVFGLDSGSLRNLSPAGTAMRGFGSLLKGTANLDPPGLGNMSNSCYQNSIVQGLASLPSLPDFLLRIRAQKSNGKSTNEALLEILDTLNNSSSNGRHFWLPDKLKSMSTWQQQDAQEYYSKILDQLDREAEQSLRIADSLKYGLKDIPEAAKVAAPRNSDALRNPLEGMLAQRVGCTQCGYSEGLSLIPFNCLTVPLGSHYLYDVRDCLDEYTKLEEIEGVECPKCTLLRAQTQLKTMSAKQLPEELLHSVQDRLRIVEEALQDDDFSDNTIIKKCQVPKKQWISSTKSKQAVIARPPKSLAVHFNRSLFNEITGAQTKNNASVQFALGLDLDSWCLGNTEDWPMDPTKSMLPQDEDEVDNDTPSCKYELRAVVTHSGRHENGHYVCYRKRLHPGGQPSNENEEDVTSYVEEEGKKSEAWFRLSDEDVNITSVDNVLRQGGVFMLFYERVDASPEIVQEQLPSVVAVESCAASNTIEASEAEPISVSDEEYGDVDKFTELVDIAPSEALPPDPLDGKDSLQTEPVDSQAIEYPQIPSADPVDSSDADDFSVISLPNTNVGFQPDITPSNRIRMRTSGFGSNSSPEDLLKSAGVRMLAI